MNKSMPLITILRPKLANYYQILSIKFAQHTSVYITLKKPNTPYYTQFRISDHLAKSSFYSNKSFLYYGKNEQWLVNQILGYLINHCPWAKFNYIDYFALKTLKISAKRRIEYYIDNTFHIFEESEQGMIFYQERNLGNDKYINAVDATFNQELRKLFATGLLSFYEYGNLFRIYIAEAGMKALDAHEIAYRDLYQQDYPNIHWREVLIPEHALLNPEKLEEDE